MSVRNGDQIITINSRKFDWTIDKSWKCQLLEDTSEYWLFFGEFEKEIVHSKLGIIRPKTKSFEFYFKNKWFNVFRFHEPDGAIKFYYCNISQPPFFNNNKLDYVDLDIDILVKPDSSFEILDLEEFAENIDKYSYPQDLIASVDNQLKDTLELINKRQFPFNYPIQA